MIFLQYSLYPVNEGGTWRVRHNHELYTIGLGFGFKAEASPMGRGCTAYGGRQSPPQNCVGTTRRKQPAGKPRMCWWRDSVVEVDNRKIINVRVWERH